jgi:hypothetical protein
MENKQEFTENKKPKRWDNWWLSKLLKLILGKKKSDDHTSKPDGDKLNQPSKELPSGSMSSDDHLRRYPEYILRESPEEELVHNLRKLNNDFQRRGIDEGQNGKQSSEDRIKQFAQSKVEELRGRIQVKSYEKLGELKITVKTHKKIAKSNEKSYKSQQRYLEELDNQSKLHSRDFRKGIGRFYLIVGILLILADIPLALELTQDGFGFERPESGDAQIRNFFSKPWGVFVANWEVFIMAIGIALCTVYIKIFWDEFLASPIQNAVRKYKNLPGVDPEDSEETKRINNNNVSFG